MLAVVVCVSAMSLSGCAGPRSRLPRTIPGKAPVYPADSHMVFNPDWSDMPLVDVPRSDWPATYASNNSDGEMITFSERINDNPSEYGGLGQRDNYSRRFYSTRTGQIRR